MYVHIDEEELDDDFDDEGVYLYSQENSSNLPVALPANQLNPAVEMSHPRSGNFLLRPDVGLIAEEKKVEDDKQQRIEDLKLELELPPVENNLANNRRFQMPNLGIISGLRYFDTKIEKLYEHPFNNIVTQLWPIASLGLLIHDIIYFTYPELRYHTTFKDVLFGLPKKANLGTILNHMGSDLINEPALYWAPTVSVLGVSLAAVLAGKYIIAATNKINKDRLPESFKSKSFSYISRLYSIYAYYRLLAVLFEKIIKYARLHQAETDCKNQGNIFSWVEAFAENQCTVCGDFEEIKNHFHDMYSGQSCLNALLASTSDPENILKKLERLEQRNDVTSFDFSQINLTEWSLENINRLLNILSTANRQLAYVNFGAKVFNYNSYQKQIFNSIIDFVRNNNIKAFEISNQNLSELSDEFVLGLSNSTVLSLTANNCRLGSSVRHFRQVLPTTSLQNLSLANDEITDLDYCDMWDGVVGSNVTELHAAGNYLGDFSLTCMKNINQSKIDTLDFSSMPQSAISSRGLSLFCRSATNSRLTKLSLANDRLDDEEFLAIAKYCTQLLLSMDLSDNNLQDSYAAKQLFNGLPATLIELKLNNVGLNNDGFIALAGYILRAQLEILQISGNNADSKGWKSLIDNLLRSRIQTLVAAVNFLDSDTVDYLNLGLKNTTQIQLYHIDLSNNPFISAEALLNLLDACAEALITELMLSYTNSDNKFAQRLASIVSSKNSFKKVDVNNTYITSDQIVNIITSSRSLKSFSAKGPGMMLNDADTFTIASSLIKIKDNLDFLKYKNLNEDEKNWLATESSVINPLQTLSITLDIWKGIGFDTLTTRVYGLSNLNDLSIDYVNGTNDVAAFQYNNSHTPALTLETLGTLLFFFVLFCALNPIYKTCMYAKQRLFSHNNNYQNTNVQENDGVDENADRQPFHQLP